MEWSTHSGTFLLYMQLVFRSPAPRRTASIIAVATVAAAALATAAMDSAPPEATTTTVLGAACLPLSVAALAIAWRHRWAELTALAGGLVVSATAATTLALDPHGGLRASWAPVVAATALGAGALPLALPATGRLLGQRWRSALGIGTVLGVALAVVLPPFLSPPRPAIRVVAAAASILALVMAAGRLWWLYRLGRQRALAVATAAVALLAVILLADLASVGSDGLWWVGRVAETIAILATAVGALLLARAPLDELLAPLAERDPFRTLEAGLAPEVRALLTAVHEKDHGTRDHLVRVTRLALQVGESLGLPPRRLRLLGLGALLHDIGKLVVPDALLGKPGPLSPDEQDVMRTHPARGAELLAHSPLLAPVAPIVRAHHERVDGAGYPDGLREASIPSEARIVSAADAWDAMTQNRVYRQGLDPGEARRRLLAGAGSHWDATVVRALLTLTRGDKADDLVDGDAPETTAPRHRAAMDAAA